MSLIAETTPSSALCRASFWLRAARVWQDGGNHKRTRGLPKGDNESLIRFRCTRPSSPKGEGLSDSNGSGKKYQALYGDGGILVRSAYMWNETGCCSNGARRLDRYMKTKERF